MQEQEHAPSLAAQRHTATGSGSRGGRRRTLPAHQGLLTHLLRRLYRTRQRYECTSAGLRWCPSSMQKSSSASSSSSLRCGGGGDGVGLGWWCGGGGGGVCVWWWWGGGGRMWQALRWQQGMHGQAQESVHADRRPAPVPAGRTRMQHCLFIATLMICPRSVLPAHIAMRAHTPHRCMSQPTGGRWRQAHDNTN